MNRAPAHAVVALLHLAAWGLVLGAPTALRLGSPLASASYTPSREGLDPRLGQFPSPADIDDDLRLLTRRVRSVRTYSVDGVQAEIPALAARHGLTVSLGAWLGGDLLLNEWELRRVIRVANAWPDVVRRVVVGNEVLLRGDLPPALLIQALQRVRAAVRQPVTYADVWELWRKHPEVLEAVDEVTIHVLPYWEDRPVAAEGAGAHVREVIREVRARLGATPLWLGEVGWPTAGRQRGPAVPGVAEQARVVRDALAAAAGEGVEANVVEAVDQPWKADLEGTVGARWGVLDAHRRSKLEGDGVPVARGAWALAAVGLGVGLGAIACRRRREASTARCLAWMALAHLLAGAWTAGLALELATSATTCDVAFTLAWFGLPPLVGLGLARVEATARARWVEALALGLAAIGLVLTIGLVFEGRYRDFPTPAFVAPALAVAAARAGGLSALRPARLRGWLVGAALLGAAALVVAEGLANGQAVRWALLLVGLALLAFRRRKLATRP